MNIYRCMAAHCIQPNEHNAVTIADSQSEKRKKKRKKKKEPSYSVHGEVIWNENIWDDNELTYYRRLREFWSTLCIDDRIQIASLEKDLVVLKMKEQQRITCNCDCCTQERREFEVDVEECFALYHDELIRMDMRNDYGDKLSQMPLEECTLNDTEFVFYWSLSSDGHQISVSPELVEGGALFIDLLESSQYDDVDEDFYDRDFEDIQEATDDLTEVQLAWARLLVGRKFFQTFIARMFEERLLVAYREKLAYDKQQKLIAEEEEEERLRKERDENRQIARQRKRERKKEQKKAVADRKKAETEECVKAEQKKVENQVIQKIEDEKKRKDKRRLTRTSNSNDANDDGSSHSSGSRCSSVERALMENVPEQAKLSECMKKKSLTLTDKKIIEVIKSTVKLKKENKPPLSLPIVNGHVTPPKGSSKIDLVLDEKPMELVKSNKKRRRKKNNKSKGDVDTEILANNTNIPGSSSILPGSVKKDETVVPRTVRKVIETPMTKNITVGTNRVSPPNFTKAASAVQNPSPESPKISSTKRESPASNLKPVKVSPKAVPKPLYEKPIEIPIPQLKSVSKTAPKNITIKKTQAQVITTTSVVASRAAPGYERSINSAIGAVVTTVTTTTQAMQILNAHYTSTAASMGATTQSVWGNTSPIPITSIASDSKTTPTKAKPPETEPSEPRVPTPKAIGSERAADRAIGSERAKTFNKDMPMNGIGDSSNCSPFSNSISNPQFFLGLQEILSTAKTSEKSSTEMFFENMDDFSSSFPTSWTSSAPLWSTTAPTVQQQDSAVQPVSSSLDTSSSSRSSPEVNSLWMQQPPPSSQTPPWSCTAIGTGTKVPMTPPPLAQQQQQQQNSSSGPIPGIIHIPRSLAPSLSPFQAFSGLDQRGVRQQWTPKLHSGFEMQPMRPS